MRGPSISQNSTTRLSRQPELYRVTEVSSPPAQESISKLGRFSASERSHPARSAQRWFNSHAPGWLPSPRPGFIPPSNLIIGY